jgi:hypothetical protein
MAFEKNPDELGALWLKSGAKGEYMTGTIDGVKVICFPVPKSGDRAPAWRVLKSKPREGQPEPDRRHGIAPITDADVPF